MMRSYRAKTLYVVLSTVLGLLPIVPFAGEHEAYKEVGGVAIYIGIMPAEMIQGLRPADHPERQMHGGVPRGAHGDHLVVALFEKDSGKRITDAEVIATMAEIGMSGQRKKLEVMKIADTITWGNYFYLPSREAYRVELQIRRPGVPGVIEAQFMHRHPQE